MTDDKMRFHAQEALLALEWLDRHVAPRRHADAQKLAHAIEKIRKHLFKLVGTNTAAASKTIQ